MALKLGELVAVLRTDNSGLKRGLAEGKAETRAAGQDMERSSAAAAANASGSWASSLGRLASSWRSSSGQFDRHIEASKTKIRELAREFDRTGNKSLLGDLGKERSQLRQLEAAARELGSTGFGALRESLSSLSGIASSAGSGLWSILPIIAGIAAAAATAVPAISLLGGALGSLPALAVGGVGVMGVLGLGLQGLAGHFRKTTSAGGAMVDKTWQVQQAQRQLASAQREVVDAQEALTRARADEVERLSDLNRALREAHLSEKEAALDEKDAQQRLADAKNAVQIAQEKINQAKASGDVAAVQRATQELLDVQKQQPDEIRRAELAYERAKLATESAKDSTSDLTKEQQRAARVGVGGSDQVRAALDRQRHAVESVTEAEHALAEARKPGGGGGGGAAAQMTKLASSAQAVVDVLKSLKPAWDSLRLDVQQRLFAGVAGEIKDLARAWLPTLHEKLGAMATTFNGLFKTFSDTAKKPEFIDKIGHALDAVNDLLGTVGKQVAGPLVDAFGDLADKSGPFIKALGGELGKLVGDFAKWIDKADKSGALKDFFDKATGFLHDVFDMGRDVGAIIGDIMHAIFSPDKKADGKEKSPWEDFKKSLDDLREWFDDPKNQQQIKDFFKKAENAAKILLKIADWVAGLITWLDKADTKFRGWAESMTKGVKKHFGDAEKWIKDHWNSMIKWFGNLPDRIEKAVKGLFRGIKSEFKSAINFLIGGWNRLSFAIGGGSFAGIPVPSATFNTPDIPYLANGGVVRATPGGRLAVVGEGREDEAVVPLSKLGSLGGHAETRLTGEFRVRGSDLVLVLREQVQLKGGGNVQAALGQR